MINQATRTMLAVALTAGCFGHDALASAMKNTENVPLSSHQSFSDPLPLVPPPIPADRDALLESLLTPNSIASRTLTSDSRTGFSRATLVASMPHSSTVKPEIPLAESPRLSGAPATDLARFTLPEPSSIILVLTGLIGLTARHQMRKSHAKYV